MVDAPRWLDLLDPTEQRLAEAVPTGLDVAGREQLARPPEASGARPTLRSAEGYVLGVLVVPVAIPAEDRIVYQEIDLVVTRERLLTVRKTPPGGAPFDPEPVRRTCEERGVGTHGMSVYRIAD